MATATELCPGWVVAPEHRDAINAIFRWCMELDGCLDPMKGLWLCGSNGTGKTTLLHIVKHFCQRIGRKDMDGNPYGFRISNAPQVCSIYEREGYKGIEEFVRLRRQAFDELGAEATLTGHYGTPLDVMQYILLGRYDNRHFGFTHVTTNLTLDDVKARYKIKVYDRIKEMFNIVYLGGRTYRGDFTKI